MRALYLMAAALLLGGGEAHADLLTVSRLLDHYYEQGGCRFNPSAGSALWRQACAGCHGAGPQEGGHDSESGRSLPPLKSDGRPRLTLDPDGVDRHLETICQQRLARPCTPQEKGDVVVTIFVE